MLSGLCADTFANEDKVSHVKKSNHKHCEPQQLEHFPRYASIIKNPKACASPPGPNPNSWVTVPCPPMFTPWFGPSTGPGTVKHDPLDISGQILYIAGLFECFKLLLLSHWCSPAIAETFQQSRSRAATRDLGSGLFCSQRYLGVMKFYADSIKHKFGKLMANWKVREEMNWNISKHFI